MAVVQQIDNHFISPIVMQRAVKLHPAVVMLALLAGGTLGGFFGLLLAVPATAVLKIVVGHLWRTYVLGEPLDESRPLGGRSDVAPRRGSAGGRDASPRRKLGDALGGAGRRRRTGTVDVDGSGPSTSAAPSADVQAELAPLEAGRPHGDRPAGAIHGAARVGVEVRSVDGRRVAASGAARSACEPAAPRPARPRRRRASARPRRLVGRPARSRTGAGDHELVASASQPSGRQVRACSVHRSDSSDMTFVSDIRAVATHPEHASWAAPGGVRHHGPAA